jgi:hypothetical protein
MSKQTLVGKTVKISQMSVAGGNLPDKWSIKLDIEIDCSNTTMEQLMEVACSGHSARVRLQTKLRLKTTTQLEAIKAAGIYKVTFAECISAKAEATPAEKVARLDLEGFITLFAEYNVSRKQAIVAFNKKHGTNHEVK